MTPSGDQVLILADYFKCEFPWLIEDDAENPDENVELLLRSEGGRLAASDRHAIAEFLHLCKSQAILEEMLSQRHSDHGFQFAPRGRMFKDHGVQCAEQFRAHHQLEPNGVIPDIFDWLRKAGLRVFRRSLPASPISGLFVRHPEAGPCILINYAEDKYRQRFSAAHEAGHALMDTDRAYNVSDQSDGSSPDLHEIRANVFASCFLMPPDLIRMFGSPDQWRRPEKVIEAADRMFVSIPAVLSALRRDRVLDNETLNTLRGAGLRLPEKQEPELMGVHTPRQKERLETLLETGLHAQYVHQAFEAHYRGLISLAKLADMLLVEPAEVGELAGLFGMRVGHG